MLASLADSHLSSPSSLLVSIHVATPYPYTQSSYRHIHCYISNSAELLPVVEFVLEEGIRSASTHLHNNKFICGHSILHWIDFRVDGISIWLTYVVPM